MDSLLRSNFAVPRSNQDIACVNTEYVCVHKIMLASCWFLYFLRRCLSASTIFHCTWAYFVRTNIFYVLLAMPKQIQLNGIILDIAYCTMNHREVCCYCPCRCHYYLQLLMATATALTRSISENREKRTPTKSPGRKVRNGGSQIIFIAFILPLFASK